ncbi:hypothetical protein [Bacillus safensis]|nr:hypothetical protein [Bacillus safensis]
MNSTDPIKEMVASRQAELEKEFKIELPLNIDPNRYLFNFRVKDLFILLPFAGLGAYLEWLLFKISMLNEMTVIFPLIPLVLMGVFLLIKDPDRKNISLGKRFLWTIAFSRREKEFMFDKKEKNEFSDDIRSKLGIFNITSGCYETLDDRLIKVIKVSNVNLETMPLSDKTRTLRQWENFLQDADEKWFPMQIPQYTKPVNLTTYLAEIREQAENKNRVQRMLADSYIKKGNDIQKDRSMVSKESYFIVSQDGTSEQSLKELNRETQLIKGKLENMLQGRYSLKAKVLDNEELFKLLYTTIDYENAQANMDYGGTYDFGLDLSLTEDEYKEMVKKKEELERTRII